MLQQSISYSHEKKFVETFDSVLIKEYLVKYSALCSFCVTVDMQFLYSPETSTQDLVRNNVPTCHQPQKGHRHCILSIMEEILMRLRTIRILYVTIGMQLPLVCTLVECAQHPGIIRRHPYSHPLSQPHDVGKLFDINTDEKELADQPFLES